jgi:hypothetical protein
VYRDQKFDAYALQSQYSNSLTPSILQNKVLSDSNNKALILYKSGMVHANNKDGASANMR